MAEIEAIGSAFEGMQTQNTRLLDGVTRRDEEFNKLTAKNIRCACVVCMGRMNLAMLFGHTLL